MRFLAGLALIVAIGAFATRPSAMALDEMIVSDLQVEASNLSVGAQDTVIAGIAKLGCALNASECARLVRAAMSIEVTELWVARTATVSFADEAALTCVGAFTQWTCWPVD